MSRVIGIDRQPVDSRTILDDCTDAKVALRRLLKRLDAGEIQITSWLFLFDELVPERMGEARTVSLDSGITVEKAMCMVEGAKFNWLRMLYGSDP